MSDVNSASIEHWLRNIGHVLYVLHFSDTLSFMGMYECMVAAIPSSQWASPFWLKLIILIISNALELSSIQTVRLEFGCSHTILWNICLILSLLQFLMPCFLCFPAQRAQVWDDLWPRVDAVCEDPEGLGAHGHTAKSGQHGERLSGGPCVSGEGCYVCVVCLGLCMFLGPLKG